MKQNQRKQSRQFFQGLILGIFLAVTFFSPPTFSQLQQIQYEQEKIPTDIPPYGGVGLSSAMSQNYLAIGAPNSGTGHAYIFGTSTGNWRKEQDLIPSSPVYGPLSHYGKSVAIDGNVAVVASWYGASNSPTASGTVFVFRRNLSGVWVQEAQLLASNSLSMDHFAHLIDISGNWILVGSLYRDQAGPQSGAVYAYRYNGGTWGVPGANGTRFQNQILVGSTTAGFHNFGSSISIQGTTALIGAPSAGGTSTSCGPSHPICNYGTVYYFSLVGSTWVEQQAFLAPDPKINNLFGFSIDQDGQKAVIGSIWDYDLGPSTGSAYVFQKVGNVWTYVQELRPWAVGGLSLQGFEWYSTSLALFGNTIVVGSPRYGQFVQNGYAVDGPGAAYMYQFNGSTWQAMKIYLASDGGSGISASAPEGDFFGKSVAMWGSEVFIGAPQKDETCPPTNLQCNSGATYRFSLQGGSEVSCPTDLNEDGVTNRKDLKIVLHNRSRPANSPGCNGNVPCPADINGDGVVNIMDMHEVTKNYGPC